ncbi:hypothetical protein [Streptomyces sp. KL116D]
MPHLLPGRDTRRREPRVTGPDALLADLLPHFTGADGITGTADPSPRT